MGILFRELYVDGNELQSIVDQINSGNKILIVKENRLELVKESEETQYYFCPGNICRHSKMNVLKVVEKLENMGFKGTTSINACRENCIKKDTDISITCTVGGICAENMHLNNEYFDDVIRNFDEERKRKNRKI